MKIKLFQLMITAVATLFSVSVLAQSSQTLNNDANIPRVTTGGTVVMEDQVVTMAANEDAGDKVVLRLPTGFNFSGTPTATATGALLLTDSVGDPTLNGSVALSDSDGDGGNDRAEVTISSTDKAGSVTFKGSVTYSGGAGSTAQGVKNATTIINSVANGIFLDADNAIAQVVASTAAVSPIALQSTTAAITLPNSTAGDVALPTQFLLSVPAGKGTSATNNTVTFTFGSGVKTADGPATTLTFTALTDGAPAIATATAASAGLSSLSADLGGATTRAAQYLVTLNNVDTTALSTPGAVSVTVSGDAGLSGSATVAVLSSTGSTISLATGQTLTDLVRGADQAQTLPTFEIKEIFATDFTGGDTITLKAPTGMTFQTAGAVSIGTIGVGDTLPGSKLTIDLTGVTGAVDTLSVSGITVTAGSTAGSTLAITAGDSSVVGESANAPFTTLAVANSEARGTVTVAGPTTAGKVGKGTAGNAGTISLSESTYGAIADQGDTPAIRVAPPAGVTITGIVATPQGTLGFGAPAASVEVAGTWLVPITAESTTAITATTPATLAITYSVASTASLGPVTFTLSSVSGGANVNGSATVANIVETTTTTSTGVIPDETSDPNSVATATINVAENFTTATTAGTFRIRLANGSGLSFDAANLPAVVAPVTGVSVDQTFATNDTLVVTVAPAGTDTYSVSPRVFISENASGGLKSVTVIDGDMAGANGASVSTGTANIIYVGDVTALDAGDDLSVGAGVTATQSVTGGLADLTVASADTGVATATISGSTVSIKGVSAGTTVVTVTDALRNTSSIAVTVVGSTAPSKTVSGGNATINGGISTDNGVTFGDGTVAVGDTISILATITTDPDHVGEAAELVVAATIAGDANIYLIESDGTLNVFDGTNVIPFSSVAALGATESIDITDALVGGPLLVDESLSGLTVSFFVGYLLGDGTLVYTSESIDLTIE